MAFQGSGIFESPRGKLRDLVFYKRKGVDIVQSTPVFDQSKIRLFNLTNTPSKRFIQDFIFAEKWYINSDWSDSPWSVGGAQGSYLNYLNTEFLSKNILNCSGILVNYFLDRPNVVPEFNILSDRVTTMIKLPYHIYNDPSLLYWRVFYRKRPISSGQTTNSISAPIYNKNTIYLKLWSLSELKTHFLQFRYQFYYSTDNVLTNEFFIDPLRIRTTLP